MTYNRDLHSIFLMSLFKKQKKSQICSSINISIFSGITSNGVKQQIAAEVKITKGNNPKKIPSLKIKSIILLSFLILDLYLNIFFISHSIIKQIIIPAIGYAAIIIVNIKVRYIVENRYCSYIVLNIIGSPIHIQYPINENRYADI